MASNALLVLKIHWRWFVWAWIFPLIVFGALLTPVVTHYPRLSFFGVGLPAFFACFYVASKPVRDRQVTNGQAMIFIVLLPIIIWATVIFGVFGLAMTTGAVPGPK